MGFRIGTQCRFALAAAVAAAGLSTLAGSAAVAAGPCTDQRDYSAGTYTYALCGVPDLDQVRPDGDGFVGLAFDGRVHCVPTSTMNFFAYLADRGFHNLPGPGDWRDPARFNEMTALIGSLGSHMGTGSRGTNGDGWLKGVASWLKANPPVKPGSAGPLGGRFVTKGFVAGGNHRIDTDFDAAKAFAPHPGDLAAHAVAGDLVVGVIGFYDNIGSIKTLEGDVLKNVLERDGGHATSVVSANATPASTAALLGVRDPSTDWADDHVQSEYVTDTWKLDAVEPVRRFMIRNDEGSRVYEAAVPTVGGDDKTRFDGYMTIEPERAVSWHRKKIFIRTPLPFNPADPVTQVISAPGGRPVVDVAVAPQSGQHAFLVKGSRKVYRGDAVTGRVRAVGTAPAGGAQLAMGGAKEILFVAAGTRLVALDRGGRVLRSARLPAPAADLQVDDERGRLVVLERGARGLTVLDTRLRRSSRVQLGGRAVADDGRAALALDRRGAMLVSRAGSRQLAVVPAKAARPAVRRDRAAVAATRVVRPRLRQLARTPTAAAISLNDQGHLFVVRRGRMVELTPAGDPVKGSPFTGLPAGRGLAMSRSFSNVPPGYELDHPEAELARPFEDPSPTAPAPAPEPEPTPEPEPEPPSAPEAPDLLLGSAANGQFTVRNAGTAAAGPFTVSLYGPRVTTQRFHLRGLAAGETSDAMPYSCPADGSLSVIIDVDREVEESNEENNVAPIDCGT